MVSFEELVDDIKSSIKTLLSENSITINCDFNEIDETATLKPYLYSIFFNLITNSIKYRKENSPLLIHVKSKKLEKGVELSFTDNGMGIDLATHGHDVFGLYKRFHEHIDGKGMGLYMVKTQTEALGGTVSVFSQENQGTTFIIKIY